MKGMFPFPSQQMLGSANLSSSHWSLFSALLIFLALVVPSDRQDHFGTYLFHLGSNAPTCACRRSAHLSFLSHRFTLVFHSPPDSLFPSALFAGLPCAFGQARPHRRASCPVRQRCPWCMSRSKLSSPSGLEVRQRLLTQKRSSVYCYGIHQQ